ncbi:MAG: Phosphomannomutase [Candidatus Methanofastidiosum methylothiophilum]|uniref:Phosphomannomutase n=1 Tax=Candidatus Methanofastidiosum methylothiophilum TaxID=1705564 RepID=A0A150IY58_9EURY|nr:MAG: Phosphomannomutase [Candidatus Methanofastidiosum methylthiophilus]KYC48481.1 MAG: Phosphomannomutase [Candidatus Methanofastidiosum methylthiophilus]KYC49923.1 MAG: Phosphomannomutase [Candidatus Methanofastidiosum methylthiophilus]
MFLFINDLVKIAKNTIIVINTLIVRIIDFMVFKAYDIRGKYPLEIDEQFSYNLGRTLGKKYKNILFGIDSRIGSEGIKDHFVTGVLDSNAKVEYAGIISTPMLYYLTKDKFDVGVIATASHNPKDFTGFKICGKDGIPLSPENDIKPEFIEYGKPDRIYDSEDLRKDFGEGYIRYYVDKFRDLNYKGDIVVDFSNGATVYEKKIIEKVFPNAYFIGDVPDGNFPNHAPDTMKKECLEMLINKVKETGASIGVIFDGDGDRIGIVDEKGNPIRGDILSCVILSEILKGRNNETVLYDLRCSRIVGETIISLGAKPLKSRVGHYFIKKTMKEENAIFAGELSNHFYFREIGGFEAPLLALYYILKSVGESRLSEVAKKYMKYSHSGEINFKVKDQKETIDKLLKEYQHGNIDYTDGITIEEKDWWTNIRPSNTEPLLRINVEANDEMTLNKKIQELSRLIEGE